MSTKKSQGFHLRTADDQDLVARLANGDVNMPGFDGWPYEKQVSEVIFEAATYQLLCTSPMIRASKLLYHRPPVQHIGERLHKPMDILGRRLMVFEKAKGTSNVWEELDAQSKVAYRNVLHRDTI